jgi:dTDP-4-amino-4,6-dideoxygalactose transaminase
MLSRRWAVATPPGAWPRRIELAEQALARRFGCAHAITVCNGSAALVVAMQALRIGPGDRVLLPAFTWVGCITAVLRLGAMPVLCDTQATRLTAQMTEPRHADIAAILAIPLYAQTLDMAALRAAYPDARIVCDLSHLSSSPALGDPLEYADLLISSLQSSKVLTCGEGGFIGTNDAELAQRMQALRTDGRVFKDDALRPYNSPRRAAHGANYAMSEITAGLLLDQLDRLDDQRARRATGGLYLRERLSALGLSDYADAPVIEAGLHYGLPVAPAQGSGQSLTQVIERVLACTGLRLDRCYPALLEGALCQPDAEPRYRHIAIPYCPAPNARHWHDALVLVPQEVLLAPRTQLDALARCLARQPVATRRAQDADPPDVTVIMVTDGTRPTLARALISVTRQSYAGKLRVLMVLDRCAREALELPPVPLPLDTLRIDLNSATVIERVAQLRDMALRLCDTDLVCFLDDDNCWTPDHLQSLFLTMQRDGVPAAHCWRRIRAVDGQPWDGSHFPWLTRGSPRERAQFDACRMQGTIQPESDIVRDTARPNGPNDAGMVDLGAWLIRTDLLRLHGLTARPDGAQAPQDGVGEDDILLARLRAGHVPIACSDQPTLEYWLGGFSNNEIVRERAWREG